MAQPSVLSDKALARFRTKTCERMLADGVCTYGARCQYSHCAALPRRNPTRHAYMPELCPYAAAAAEGRGGGCAQGELCGLAHSLDEVNYHPMMYKTRLCQGGSACEDFCCPFAHSVAELREREAVQAMGPRSPRAAGGSTGAGQTSGSSASSTPTLPAASATGDSWWELDDLLWVASEARAVVPSNTREPGSAGDCGEALAGGRVVPGLLKVKVRGERAIPTPCRVKMLLAGRAERVQAGQVARQLKWWMSLDAKQDKLHSPPEARAQGPLRRALALRRTVATACLALPEAAAPTLAECVDRGFLGGARGPRGARSIAELCGWGAQGPQLASAVLQAGAWARQLAEEVVRFHAAGCAHLCISPSTVVALQDGSVRLGDFLGKIRALGVLHRGCGSGPHEGQHDGASGCGDGGTASTAACSEEDRGWAAWLPAEAQQRAWRANVSPRAGSQAAAGELGNAELLCVDLWQLGVVIFFLLTGKHPFGDRRDLRAICENIRRGDAVNLGMLASSLPLFADLVARLIAHAPEHRWSAQQALGHPALWSWDEASRAVARTPCLIHAALQGGVAQVIPALAPLLVGGAAGCGGGAAFEDSAGFLAALGLQPAHVLQQGPAPIADGAAQWCRAVEAMPMAMAACCEESGLDEQSIVSGSLLRCIWREGVRYRKGRSRNDHLDRTAYFNVEVFVKERVHGWVRAKHGWLPLYGVGEAAGRPLFELVSSPAASAPPLPLPSPRLCRRQRAQQARPARLLEAPPGLGGDVVAHEVPAPTASEAALEGPPERDCGVTAPRPPATTTKEAAFEALLSWAKVGPGSCTTRLPTKPSVTSGSELNPHAPSWFPPPLREAAPGPREPVKVHAGATQPPTPSPPLPCGVPAYVKTGRASGLCPDGALTGLGAHGESCKGLFQIQSLHALLGIAASAALPAGYMHCLGPSPMFA